MTDLSENIKHECKICYDDFDTAVLCMCKTAVCCNCFVEYSNSCWNDKNKLTKCVVCPKEYLIEGFSDEETAVHYAKIILKYITKNPNFKNAVNAVFRESNILDALRKKKMDFINKIPKGLRYVIDTVLKDKYKKAIVINKNYIEKRLNTENHKINCFSGICPTGKISDQNGNWECDTCQLIFCKKCEKSMNENHTCAKEDLDSVLFIASLVHCPDCQCPCEKIDGCNSVTCSNCGKKFNYENGGDDHGGHDKKLDLKQRFYSLFEELNDQDKYNKDILDIIQQFENNKPEIFNLKNFSEYINLEEELSNDQLIELFDVYSSYRLSQIKSREYTDVLLAIRQLHIDDKLNEETIVELFEKVI